MTYPEHDTMPEIMMSVLTWTGCIATGILILAFLLSTL